MIPHFQPPPEIATAIVPSWAIASAALLAAFPALTFLPSLFS